MSAHYNHIAHHQTVYIVPLDLPDSWNNWKWKEPILLEGLSLEALNPDVYVTSCVDQLTQFSDARCRIVNHSDIPVVIPKDYPLEPVSNFDINLLSPAVVEDIMEQVEPVDAPSSNGPDALKDDIRFNLDITLSPKDKQKFLHHLLQNRNRFSTGHASMGRTNLIKHHIDMPPRKPIYQQAYRLSPQKRQELDNILDDMLKHKLLEHSTSKWSSPCLLLNKPSGHGKRLLVDLRKVNKATNPSTYPLPKLETIWDAIGEAKPKVFSVLDLVSGFHQIPLDDESKEKTAFSTMDRHLQYLVMPQGLASAPITFQKLMVSVLKDLLYKCCICYVDDIIVYSKDLDSHIQDLQAVMDRLATANLTLSAKKCEFGKKSVKYLGHILSANGIITNPDKTAAIDNYPRPKKPRHVKRFTGMTGYYRKFIPRYADLVSPLSALLKSGTKFKWTPACTESFNTLKQKLVSEPVLRYADHSRPFTLTTDASKNGISYILGQQDDNGHDYVCYYGARSLKKHEKNYSATDLEALAVVEGVDKYHVYLIDKPFTIYTDHKALKYLIDSKFKGESGKMARWAQQLMPYQYTVVYKQGKQNLSADALSRVPYTIDVPQVCQLGISDLMELDSMPDQQQWIQYDLSYDDHLCVQPNEEQHIDAVVGELNSDESSDTPNISLDHLPEAQLQCPELGPIYKYHKDGILPSSDDITRRLVAEKDNFTILDNRLHHLPRPSKTNPRLHRQVVIPLQYRQTVLEYYHDSVAGGSHQGFDRTYNAIRSSYYWPGMYTDIYDYIKGCPVCQTSKRAYHNLPPPLHPLPIAEVFERWHIDHITNLTKTPDGYAHILVIVDSTSKWVEAIPTRTQTAEETARVLYRDIFTRYGAPRCLVSDRGKAFMSHLVNALCEIFSVKMAHTTPYKPSTNSTAERINSYLLASLRAYCDKAHTNWPQVLPGVCMAYRSTPATQSSQFSPYYLVFGKDMARPLDVNLKPKATLPEATKHHLNGYLENVALSRQLALENQARAQQKSKARYDIKAQ